MIILGLSGAHDHDPAAAILVDGEIVAAVEEERLVRDRHAPGRMPLEAVRYCLHAAGISAKEVDVVAFPSAPIPITTATRWRYAWRNVGTPDVALGALFDGNRGFRRVRARVLDAGRTLGINWERTEFVPVAHHLAHASSAYHLSGFSEKAAIMSIDGLGKYVTTFLGYGENGRIHEIASFYAPDSLAAMYGAFAEALGFRPGEGEYAVMTMAASGDASRADLRDLIDVSSRSQRMTAPLLLQAFRTRTGRDADCAAAMQHLFERRCFELIDTHLADVLRASGRLAFAGGAACNTRLNQRIGERADVDELFVPPAAGDAGTALGTATYVAAARGEPLRRMRHAAFGPGSTTRESIESLESRVERPHWRMLKDVPKETAALIAAGHPVAWFQGRMEFGPYALGTRSILGCANDAGIVGRVNAQLEADDPCRAFCASVLDRSAREIVASDRAAPFMTATFEVKDSWKARIPAVLNADGTANVQIVERETNPRFHALLEEMQRLTGVGVVLSTALCRAGEPIVCSPDDTLALFYGSKLEYLVMEDILVTKEER